MHFPAEHITTQMEWMILCCREVVRRQVHELKAGSNIAIPLMKDWGKGRKLKPGYRVIALYGPPGTGKHSRPHCWGNILVAEVFRIDLVYGDPEIHRGNRENLAAPLQ